MNPPLSTDEQVEIRCVHGRISPGPCDDCAASYARYQSSLDLVNRLRDYIDNVDDVPLRLEAANEIERLQGLLACAYQLAGVVGAPVRFLDAFSRYEGGIDSLLPVSLEECDEFKRPVGDVEHSR